MYGLDYNEAKTIEPKAATQARSSVKSRATSRKTPSVPGHLGSQKDSPNEIRFTMGVDLASAQGNLAQKHAKASQNLTSEISNTIEQR
jgi:hypothetical protein